jgi:hypothetical protein
MFTIHANINGKVLPLLYALIPNKKEKSYTKMFNMIKNYVKAPKSFNCDFEKAILNATKKSFKDVKVNGCFFHLAQNLWRHLQQNGLTDEYNKGKKIYKSFQLLKCLPFLPVADVVDGFNLVKSKSPVEFNPMLDYFETYYIGNFKRNSKSIRETPLFPICLWNVYDRVLVDLARTNNSLEVWHKNFEVLFMCLIYFVVVFL